MFTQKANVPDTALFQRLCHEASKGDEITITVTTEWHEDHSLVYASAVETQKQGGIMRSQWLMLAGAGVVMVLIGYPTLMVCRSISDTISDAGYYRSDTEHHLPHGYDRRMRKSLAYLRDTTIFYCQNHKGMFPPMQDALQTRHALSPFAKPSSLFLNPATQLRFQPNAALQGHRFGEIIRPDDVLVFYDAQPPSTYPEVYYVMLSGRIGHIDIKDWPKLKQKYR